MVLTGATTHAHLCHYFWVLLVRELTFLLPFSLPRAADCCTQKGLLLKLKQDFINAESAWDACKPMEEHNTALVTLVADHLRITREEANARLMTRIPSSRRRNSRAAATVVAYR